MLQKWDQFILYIGYGYIQAVPNRADIVIPTVAFAK